LTTFFNEMSHVSSRVTSVRAQRRSAQPDGCVTRLGTYVISRSRLRRFEVARPFTSERDAFRRRSMVNCDDHDASACERGLRLRVDDAPLVAGMRHTPVIPPRPDRYRA
jgi:hypothetical protein